MKEITFTVTCSKCHKDEELREDVVKSIENTNTFKVSEFNVKDRVFRCKNCHFETQLSKVSHMYKFIK